MLSYRHAFHAGNRADMLKHAALDAILRRAVTQRGPILYLETHSGPGVYDLTGPEARKTGEAAAGVGAVWQQAEKAPKPLLPWLDTVKTFNAAPALRRYPGSPLLAAHHLRADDRIVLFEKHPTEASALAKLFETDDRIRIQKSDGYQGALRLEPRRGERLIVLIDPSYETEQDMISLAEWVPRALRRWTNPLLAIWLPLFVDAREEDLGAFLADLAPGYVAGARWSNSPDSETSLTGTALVVYNIDSDLGETITGLAASLQSLWSQQDR